MIEFQIDFELYKIFYTVAKHANITKAAEALVISQPAVTMSIKKLEDLLQTTLFVRNKRGVTLTTEGKVLYEHVSTAMENIKIGENRLASLKTLETGSIRIGIGSTLTKHFLVHYLEIFHKRYPNVNINIDTSMTSEILKKLDEGKLDVAIIANDTDNFKNFNVSHIKDLHYTFVCNGSYNDLIGKTILLEELNNYPLLLQHPNTNSRRMLDNFTAKNNTKLTSYIELSSHTLIIEFAKIGLGIGFVAEEFIQQELENKQLFKINLFPSFPSQKLLVLTKKNFLPSFSTQKFLDIINYKL